MFASTTRVGLIQALGGRMKMLATCGLTLSLMSSPAMAVCAVEPLKPELSSADTVYVGTVVRSELVPTLESLRSSKSPRERLVQIRHTVEPEITLKGDPAQAFLVFSAWRYDNPKSKVKTIFAEQSSLMPGDTLLVVAKSGVETFFGPCTATRNWNADTAKIAYSALSAAP